MCPRKVEKFRKKKKIFKIDKVLKGWYEHFVQKVSPWEGGIYRSAVNFINISLVLILKYIVYKKLN